VNSFKGTLLLYGWLSLVDPYYYCIYLLHDITVFHYLFLLYVNIIVQCNTEFDIFPKRIDLLSISRVNNVFDVIFDPGMLLTDWGRFFKTEINQNNTKISSELRDYLTRVKGCV